MEDQKIQEAPLQEGEHRLKKSLVAIIIVACTLLVPIGLYYFYFYRSYTPLLSHNQNVPGDTLTNPFSQLAGSEDGTEYKKTNLIKSQEAMLKILDRIKSTDNTYVYLKNYAVYLQSRVSLNISNYSQAKEYKTQNFTDIFDEIKNSLDRINGMENKKLLTSAQANMLRARYFYIFSYAKDNSMVDSLSKSKWSDGGVSEELAFDRLNLKLSEENLMATDSLSVALNLHALTYLLNRDAGSLDKKESATLVADLKDKIQMYKKATTTTMFSSPHYTILVPDRFYLESLVVLYHYDKNSVKKSDIDQAYTKIKNDIASNSRGPKDVINSFGLFARIAYLSYLYEANDGKISADIASVLQEIEEYPKYMQNNPEIIYVFKSYVRAMAAAKPGEIIKGNILEISKKDDGFKRFLINLSVSR